MPELVVLGSVLLAFAGGYFLGICDKRYGKPPPPERGTYDSGEHEDRVDEYPDSWV